MADIKAETVQPELKRVMGTKLLLLFIVGDILGTGVYALTGQVAGEIGGAAWAPILLAFAVATITALSYLELVTKYPQAAGAALYTHKAFGVHFLTFLVTFGVLCSGITSASTASKFLAENFMVGFHLGWGQTGVTAVAVTFMLLLAVVNLRGAAESVKFNIVLTAIELTGLLIVIAIGFWAMGQGNVDFSRVVVFETETGKSVFLALTGATALAFFSMVGFEDSVNMAEETRDPVRIFPKVMLTGLTITVSVYLLVSIAAVAVVPVGQLSESATPLLEVVRAGAPNLPVDVIYPFLSIFAVANTALINMLMASRLLYGMAKQDVLPRGLSAVLPGRRTPWASIAFTTAIAVGLIIVVTNFMGRETVTALGGTTALLLLAVFTVVNIACIVLRRTPIDRPHFRSPGIMPFIGAGTCAFLLGPWAQDAIEYRIAGLLLLLGLALWVLTWIWNRAVKARKTRFSDPSQLS
ncbi:MULTISPECIES: APC family permease [Arthrobacter]|uniref:APC family permease n=1 Tax=Arthrobacter jinronghuae TaxID=2964609 RepID=A0ABT1NU05_9MICC|nr:MULTISPECIES: APC family permease [Arthrobacter]MCQ1950204.1 APC family permease [Arthrobacter jinronghuae]MCQ1953397.1 APC family permease [Arthrobacter sp. zg-Y238]MCQ1956631.1 APC family permease [Arthrobacter jinronghuae]UWX77188.1 APC family permease [Arthrobacter jinronghuae]